MSERETKVMSIVADIDQIKATVKAEVIAFIESIGYEDLAAWLDRVDQIDINSPTPESFISYLGYMEFKLIMAEFWQKKYRGLK